ncbi:fibronectin type III domain-containing protein 7-like [Hoplias malabaricus]|uniref:fibronectin type III domain-containing protein 7-like n=1 Tax=Hoplias malabaricus TaxID=27720 RepID=UPI0034629328
MVNTNYDVISNTALVGWSDNDGSVSFVALLQGNGSSTSCSTTGTNCTFTKLTCGLTYSITVKAVSNHCNSSWSQSAEFQTVPCASGNVSASWQCANRSAVVMWAPILNVNLYSVMALGRDGDVKQCNSSTSSCQLSQMHCGQTYNITVTPYTIYSGVSSAALSFDTGPCAPTNLSVALQCQSNLGTASWLPSVGAESYVATATAPDGHTHTCSSSSTSCVFTDFHCGESYSVTVAAVKQGCTSDPSIAVVIRTAPCPPANISAAVDCNTNTGHISWSSAAGAMLYTAQLMAGNGHSTSCSTNASSCVVMLDCGQIYTAVVLGSTDTCNSSQSTSLQFHSAPCSPTHTLASLNCTSNSATISWNASLGGTSYLVNAVGSSGYNTSCSSTNPQCSIASLQCGQDYSISVTAQSNNCSSPASQTITFSAAPCPNTNLQASLVCSSSVAFVSWTLGSGTQLSNVMLQSIQNQQQFSCISNGSSCSTSTLPCGQLYKVTVTGNNQNCSTPSGVVAVIETAPCAPTGITVTETCDSNMTTVSWSASTGNVAYYVASADAGSGLTLTCNSSSTSCDITGLTCGQVYNVSVSAYGNGCVGGRSLPYSLKTAPCAPQAVKFQLVTCPSSNLSVSWQPSSGALSYRAEAVTFPGHLLSCRSTDTSCVIPGLSCGLIYEVSVVAMGDTCNSSYSISSQVRTDPCSPSKVNTVVNCSTNTATLSWTPPGFIGAIYRATAVNIMTSSSIVGCNSTNSSCTLTGLACGAMYNVTVTATENNCSVPSAMSSFFTAPCVPILSGVSLDCSSGSALAVWSGSGGADQYYVSAVDSQGGVLSCNNTQTLSCTVWGLHCGRTYTFSVTAAQGQCTSSASNTLQTKTASCPAQAIQTTIDCHNSTASVSWAPGVGAVSHSVLLQSSDGHTYICNSTTSSCSVTNLPCGQTYSVTVAALGQNCSSVYSTGSPVSTAPCAPQNVSATVNCSSNSATVLWQSSQGATYYFVTATSSNGQTTNCTSTSTSCSLPPLVCGQNYTITVMAKDSNCTSASSTPVHLQTVWNQALDQLWWFGQGQVEQTSTMSLQWTVRVEC